MNNLKLTHLEEAHRVLDQKILDLEANAHSDSLHISDLKKQKLKLKDQIQQLREEQNAKTKP